MSKGQQILFVTMQLSRKINGVKTIECWRAFQISVWVTRPKRLKIYIDIDIYFLENIDIAIDIDKGIMQNIDIDKILYQIEFGISNRARLGPGA